MPSDVPKSVLRLECKVETDGKDDFRPIGSAVLTTYEEFNILVTAKHLVRDGRDLTVSFTKKTGAIGRRSVLEAKAITNTGWFEHPSADVAIIPFPVHRSEDDVLRIPSEHWQCFDDVLVGSDVFVAGYPMGLSDLGAVLPLLKTGIVSLKRSDRMLVLDADVFPGNSGGPVFSKPSAIDYSTGQVILGNIQPARLVGIVSAYVTYRDMAISEQTRKPRIVFEENSGITLASPTDAIREIFSLNEFKVAIHQIGKRIQESRARKQKALNDSRAHTRPRDG
jgi:hypothetical protein